MAKVNWAVIMAGGYGERFWPMSRRKKPKQLLPIVGDRTMIQQTVARLETIVDYSRMMVVTNREQAPVVHKQLPRVKNVVAEPIGRNTAPCIGLAAAIIGKHDPDAVMVVLPADSYIRDVRRYRQVVSDALDLAGRENVLVTIGIQPTFPHTGFGYIELGEELAAGTPTQFWKAHRFVEKPDLKTAKEFFASGGYRWNAGMFVWSLRAIAEAFREHQPETWASCERIRGAVATKSFGRVLAREYRRMKRISIDYAIMERADNVVVANGDFDWDDVGDWPAVGRHFAKDANGNVARGEFVGLNASNCVVVSTDKHLVAAVGANDLVIVHTADATLVCHKNEAQKVRDLVKKLAEEKKYKRFL
ncbi:MAG: mannose-1-phosphate guanylyltransferase [Verrucomicrobiia bacterium]